MPPPGSRPVEGSQRARGYGPSQNLDQWGVGGVFCSGGGWLGQPDTWAGGG